MRYNGVCSNDCIITNGDAFQDDRLLTDPYAAPDSHLTDGERSAERAAVSKWEFVVVIENRHPRGDDRVRSDGQMRCRADVNVIFDHNPIADRDRPLMDGLQSRSSPNQSVCPDADPGVVGNSAR